MIFSLIKDAVSWAISSFKKKRDAASDLKLADLEARKQALLSKNICNTEWEIAQISNRDETIRYASFFILVYPIVIATIWPELGNQMKQAWAGWPPAYYNTVVGVLASGFGIKHVPRLVGSTVKAVRDALKK